MNGNGQDQDAILSILLAYYLNLVKRRNLSRRLICRLLTLERLQYTPRSHNPIIGSILSNDDLETRKHLMISRLTFSEIVKYLPRRNDWSSEFKLLVFLFWLANGTSHIVVEQSLEMPETSVTEIVQKILDFTVDNIMPKTIKYPQASELEKLGRQFSRRCGSSVFKNVVGAVHGCDWSYLCPVDLRDQYINQKMDYSIKCQAVCDANLNFLDVFVGYPGSVVDSQVLYNSPIYRNKLYPPPPFIILGDSGYPCRLDPIRLITPFKRNRRITVEQLRFNKKLSKATDTVECAFGLIKMRWCKTFEKPLDLNLENFVKIVAACCTFHNICLKTKDTVLRDLTVDQEEDEFSEAGIRSNHPNHDQITALQYRQQMVDQI